MKIESVKDRMVFPQANADYFLAQISGFSENYYSSKSHRLVQRSTSIKVNLAQCGI